MAVTTGYVGSAAIAWSASATATVSGQSIGTASWDRIVVVAVSIEADFAVNGCTLDGVAMTAGPSLRNTTATADLTTAFFYLPDTAGTTADVAVTLSGSTTTTGRISVWATTGAALPHFDSNTNQGTGTNITLTGVTISTNGAGYWAWANNTAAVTGWTNATERDDTAVGASAYQHSVADSTTAGTATITADGANAQQVIVGMSFNERPPAGADLLPQYETPPFPPNMLSLAIAATAGAILSPYPYVQPAIPTFTHASTTTNYVFTRNLYYQAKIAPVPQEAVVVAPTTMDWAQPLSTVPPSTFLARLPGSPFVPKEAVLENTVTPDNWLLPFQKAAPATKLNLSNLIHAPAPVSQPYSVFDVQTTYLAVRVLQYQDRFETIAVTAEDNTVTIEKWQQPLSKAAARPAVASALYTPFVFVAAPAVTVDEWLPRWDAPSRRLLSIASGQPFVSVEAPRVTPDEWMQPFAKAVPAPHLNISDITYVQAPPVVDNTVTIDKWQLTWNLAAKAPKPVHTQPFYGFPYLGVDNYRFQWDWSIQWQGPPRLWPLGKPYQPFVPAEATRDNTQTPDKWMQAFRAPPRYWPVKVQTPPFVPKEAVLENTQTPDKWLIAFRGAPPTKPIYTQPFYGFPYAATSNLTTSLEWMQAWQGPPRIRPAKTQVTYPVQPVVAASNLTTSLEWLQAWRAPVVRPAVNHTQPLYGFPYAQASNLTTSLEWMQQWKGPPRYRPVKIHHQWLSPTAPAAAYAVFDVQTAYLARRTSHYQDLAYGQPPLTFVNTVTPDKWLQGFQKAVSGRPVRHTQPLYGFPYVQPSNLITTWGWQQSLSIAAVARPAQVTPSWATDFPYTTEGVVCVPAFTVTAFEFDAFQTCVDTGAASQDLSAGVTLSVEIHVCGWGEQDQQTDVSSEQGEEASPFTEQAQSDDEYDEQDECGR